MQRLERRKEIQALEPTFRYASTVIVWLALRMLSLRYYSSSRVVMFSDGNHIEDSVPLHIFSAWSRTGISLASSAAHQA